MSEASRKIRSGDQIVPGDLVEVTMPIWLSGRVAQDAGDPPDISAGTQFRVIEPDENDEIGEEDIELIPPDMYEGAKLANYTTLQMVATLIVPRAIVKRVTG